MEVPGDCLRGWPAGKMIRRKKVASGGGQVVAVSKVNVVWLRLPGIFDVSFGARLLDIDLSTYRVLPFKL